MDLIIYKYDVTPGEFTLELPWKAQILCVQVQNNTPRLWVQFASGSTPCIERYFRCVPTGVEFNDNPNCYCDYIGTFQIDSGALVFHLFEEIY